MISVGNGFTVHDVERNRYGTSLGMNIEILDHPRKWHKHQIYAISEIIRDGGLEEAVEQGVIDNCVMFEFHPQFRRIGYRVVGTRREPVGSDDLLDAALREFARTHLPSEV